jgi:hypothetical protein
MGGSSTALRRCRDGARIWRYVSVVVSIAGGGERVPRRAAARASRTAKFRFPSAPTPVRRGKGFPRPPQDLPTPPSVSRRSPNPTPAFGRRTRTPRYSAWTTTPPSSACTTATAARRCVHHPRRVRSHPTWPKGASFFPRACFTRARRSSLVPRRVLSHAMALNRESRRAPNLSPSSSRPVSIALANDDDETFQRASRRAP